ARCGVLCRAGDLGTCGGGSDLSGGGVGQPLLRSSLRLRIGDGGQLARALPACRLSLLGTISLLILRRIPLRTPRLPSPLLASAPAYLTLSPGQFILAHRYERN